MARADEPPDFWLIEHRSCGSAPGLAQRGTEFPGKTGLFIGTQEGRNGEAFAARNEKQPVDAELFQLYFVEPDPERIENPFARATEMAHFAYLERGRRDGHLLVSRGVPVIEPESPIQQQDIEPEEAEYRPGANQKKYYPGHKADAAEQQHQNQKSCAAERAVRRKGRRKNGRFKIGSVVGVHWAEYTEIMAKIPTRKIPARTRKAKPRKQKRRN